jgi:hypothetical protein
MPGDVKPAVPQCQDAAGRRGIVPADVVPAFVAGMSRPAVELHHREIGLVEPVPVGVPAALAEPGLSGPVRQAVLALHVAVVAILQDRVQALRVGA